MERASYITPKLVPIHGSIFGIRCVNDDCPYGTWNVAAESVVPGLDSLSSQVSSLEHDMPLKDKSKIPLCPFCRSAFLRPAVVWYGERLPCKALSRIDDWLDEDSSVDLVLIIGTTRTPFVYDALIRGAAVARFDLFDGYDEGVSTGTEGQWFVSGDVAYSLPDLVSRLATSECGR